MGQTALRRERLVPDDQLVWHHRAASHQPVREVVVPVRRADFHALVVKHLRQPQTEIIAAAADGGCGGDAADMREVR